MMIDSTYSEKSLDLRFNCSALNTVCFNCCPDTGSWVFNLWEASEIEPNIADLKKRSTIAKEFSTKIENENNQEVAKKVMGLWVDLCACVTNIVSANSKLQGTVTEGKQSMQVFFKEGGVEKISFVKSLRKKMVALLNKLDDLKPKVGAETHELDPLLCLEIPPAFLSELHRECIDDLCSFGVSEAFQVLDAARWTFACEILECRKKKDADNLEQFKEAGEQQFEYFLQWSKGQESYWGANIRDDAQEEDFSEVFQKTIHKIPALQTQTFCKNVSEAVLVSNCPSSSNWFL